MKRLDLNPEEQAGVRIARRYILDRIDELDKYRLGRNTYVPAIQQELRILADKLKMLVSEVQLKQEATNNESKDATH